MTISQQPTGHKLRYLYYSAHNVGKVGLDMPYTAEGEAISTLLAFMSPYEQQALERSIKAARFDPVRVDVLGITITGAEVCNE